MLYDGETDEQIILDTLESIDGEIEQKADTYAKLIKNMEADIETLSKEEDRLRERRKAIENRKQRLKDALQANLEFIGKTRFKTALFSFSVANNWWATTIFHYR